MNDQRLLRLAGLPLAEAKTLDDAGMEAEAEKIHELAGTILANAKSAAVDSIDNTLKKMGFDSPGFDALYDKLYQGDHGQKVEDGLADFITECALEMQGKGFDADKALKAKG